MIGALKKACDALAIAQEFCNSLSAEDCPDKVAIRINEALEHVQKAIQSDEAFRCVGVIDSDGWIYPEPPEAGTQIFVKVSNVAPTVAAEIFPGTLDALRNLTPNVEFSGAGTASAGMES